MFTRNSWISENGRGPRFVTINEIFFLQILPETISRAENRAAGEVGAAQHAVAEPAAAHHGAAQVEPGQPLAAHFGAAQEQLCRAGRRRPQRR